MKIRYAKVRLLCKEEQTLHRNDDNSDPINVSWRLNELKHAVLSVPGRMKEVQVMLNFLTCFKMLLKHNKNAAAVFFICGKISDLSVNPCTKLIYPVN